MYNLIKWIEQKSGWLFRKTTSNTNHDYPFHDFHQHENEGEDAVFGHYVVGQNNIDSGGDQHKRFVSKRMIIVSNEDSPHLRLNHSLNTEIVLPPKIIDPAQTVAIFEIELHTNIKEVFYTLGQSDYINIYCEGVLPEETRDAE